MEAGIHELTAGYALDALDPAERDAFEQHLGSCEQCQEELASFWEVTSALAVAADGPAPSAALRERIVTSARAEKQTVVPLDSRRRVSPVLAAVTAIAAAVAIGLGIYSISLNGKLDDSRSALTAQESATAVLADPDATTVALQSGSGRRRRRSGRVGSARRRRSPRCASGKDVPGVGGGRRGSPRFGRHVRHDRQAGNRAAPYARAGRCSDRGHARERRRRELADAADGRGVRSGLSRARSGTPHSAAATSVTCRRTGLPIRTVHLFA